MKRLCLLCANALLLSCAAADEDRITEWQGDEPHLIVQGTIDGEDVDFELRGADAMNASKDACELEWAAPPLVAGGDEPDLSQAKLNETTLLAQVEVAGETRFWSLELKSHDFRQDSPGDVIDVIPRVETQPPSPSEVWIEVEWQDAFDGEEIFESGAQSGIIVTRGITGTEMAGIPVFEEGSSFAAGFVDASWSARDELVISFTSPCVANDYDVE